MDVTDGWTVKTRNGRVQGLRRPGHVAFLGVPFAEPPVGELRFAAPVPRRPWEGVLPTIAHGPTPLRAPTPGLVPEPAVPGDDTLSVSVFTPEADPAARLPVLVWIHGGAYTSGSPASPWYDGAAFARDGVVTVVISYRLGFDGFGAIPGSSANRAVMDWLCALEWVQANIEAFGGDPARVTLAGQSAGGGAVLTLLGMPAAASLFRAVWASSPVLPVRALEDAERTTRRLAARLGVAPSREALAAVPEERILAEQMAAARPHGLSLNALIERAPSFCPVVDGDLIPEPTIDALARGVGGDVDLVVGSNDNEVLLPAESLPSWIRHAPEGLVLWATGLHGHEMREYRAIQRIGGVSGAVPALGQEVTDRVFRRQVVRVASARAASARASTRVYRFAWPSPTKGGAIHCLDLPFFWDVLDREDTRPMTGEHPPRSLVDAVHGAATALVRGEGPGFPEWDAAERRVALIGGDEEHPVRTLADGYAGLSALLH